MKSEHVRHQVRRSLRLGVLEGSASAVMVGLTQNFITPLALELKANTTHISWLAGLPSFTMAAAQLAAPDLSERAGSRKGFILTVYFLHALMFIPILLVPYLFNVSPVWWLIAFVTISTVLGTIAYPSWGSMMADLVPVRLRGRYFGSRGMITGFITQVFFFIAGGILMLFSGAIFTGYAVLFAGATFFRLLSFFFFSQMYEPAEATSKEKGPGLFELIRNIGSSNLGKFIVFFSLIDFSVSIASPYFAVFMRRDLNFSYITYVIICSASQISNILFLPFWGRRADSVGNLKIIKIVSILMPFVPLLWLVSSNVFYLIAANAYSGFVWSGFGLAGNNFAYDASEPELRTKYLAMFAAIDGIACAFGVLLGGYIAPHLPELFGYQLRTLFTISGVMRGLVVLLLLRKITEVRRVADISHWQVIMGRTGDKRGGTGRNKYTYRSKDATDKQD
jgi:MFS family permease